MKLSRAPVLIILSLLLGVLSSLYLALLYSSRHCWFIFCVIVSHSWLIDSTFHILRHSLQCYQKFTLSAVRTCLLLTLVFIRWFSVIDSSSLDRWSFRCNIYWRSSLLVRLSTLVAHPWSLNCHSTLSLFINTLFSLLQLAPTSPRLVVSCVDRLWTYDADRSPVLYGTHCPSFHSITIYQWSLDSSLSWVNLSRPCIISSSETAL